jgi:hypothetical protein
VGVIPEVRVELIVPDPNAPYLTLDDPVRGELDNASYPLFDGDPSTTVDLTAESFAYSTRRGRSSELDEISTGTLAVSFRNYAGTYLPASLVPANTDIVPGKRVRLYLDDVGVFDGRIADWELEYNYDRTATAQLVAVDALGVLAESELADWTTTAQTSDVRIEAVLDRAEVDFPANRDIATGSTGGDIGADVVDAGTNALVYVQKITYSDLGYVYASRLGVLTFEPAASIITTVQAAFADDGTGIPFSGIQPSSSTRYLYNRVSITRRGGVEQIVEDAASQALYGVRTLSKSDLLMNSDTDALNLAGSLLSFYKDPATRIEALTVNLGALTAAQRTQVLSLELGDFASVTWTPQGSTQLALGARIEGIDLSGAFDGLGAVVLSMSPAEWSPLSFILDDAVYGELDTSKIYY